MGRIFTQPEVEVNESANMKARTEKTHALLAGIEPRWKRLPQAPK